MSGCEGSRWRKCKKLKTRENRKRWHDYRKALLDSREHKYMKGRKDLFSFVYFITGYFHTVPILLGN